ncbi:hypothetical protein SAMN04487947_0666 [Halogeometricum rufum]|jgi:hypothetical protein|uniref:Uncharacterized protein n=1 Tax=Halogeometricum rufum TaxID=553469 RepID=A0A1I6G6Z6_9EURY|nr:MULTISPECIES: hypothetical protein [Halogeometricum]MUV57315.1 hypothetical protein [Halogeometricum sp. CBA1124]SFR37964.1 hypothetical protein SAMN04487947_0666 [Halogeometricum rufum]
MPDTKNGRERKGRNKRSQLQESLYSEEIEALEADEELPSFESERTRRSEFLADELPDDE